MVAADSGYRLPVAFACALSVPLGDYMVNIMLLLLAMKPMPLVIRTTSFYVEIDAGNFDWNYNFAVNNNVFRVCLSIFRCCDHLTIFSKSRWPMV